MSKKTIAIGLIVIGVILFFVSLFFDSLGLGGAPGMGLKQIAGMIVGVVVAIIGAWVLMGEKNTKK